MGGVFFAPLSGCACILGFAPHCVCFCTLINSMLLLLGKGSCLSALIMVKSSLTLFKSLNGITSKFCLFLVSGRFGWMMKSLPAGLGKKSNFKCRWILDHNDADVGAFLDSLLQDMEKQSRFDRLKQRMKEAEGAGPRSILSSSRVPTSSSGVAASGTVPTSAMPPISSPGVSKTTGKSTSAVPVKPFSVEKEEGVKEDLSADLRQKRRKRKVLDTSAKEAALGGDSAWKHKVNPIDRAFPPDYNFRAALDAGLTNSSIREVLEPLVPEQLLGTAEFLACQLTACLQVGVEKTFAAKVQLEKELVAAREQIEVLTAERDSALAAPLLHAKIKSLKEELQRAEGGASFRHCSYGGEKQTALDEAEVAAVYWRDEWKSLGEETEEMVQETFEILMDQVRHLNTRWDPKAKKIYNPKAEAQSQPEIVEQPGPVEQAGPRAEEQRVEEVADGEGGVCPS
ncbi:hypothetical protein PIB30_042821 [Stylosanthes scabra]|uniref:Uncharacterized protein n=1 Tax=Stylosanthes scabra TaxID=79078 RepID=A0ABU6UIL1_9FABA|nr:hypothetical protein [Stylosanthes scabra]